jgi:hypothetical protein
VASLGLLTALRNLKFDLAQNQSMSDDQLQQLSRLRLTSLSLPSLCNVRWNCTLNLRVACQPVSNQPPVCYPVDTRWPSQTWAQWGVSGLQTKHGFSTAVTWLSHCLQNDGGALAELAACRTSLRELSIRGDASGPDVFAAVAGA